MDNEFDGFMKTLDNLSKKKSPSSDNDKQIDPSSSFDVDIDIDIDDILSSDTSPKFKSKPISKSFDSSNTGEFASMHNQFMQSIKEINDLQLSHDEDINDNNIMNTKNNKNTPKLSELIQKGSIDSRVDEELKQLLETGTCKQQEPEQNDTVELSISDDDDDDDDNQSESEIILQNIDDLESVKSGNTVSIIASPSNNTNKKQQSPSPPNTNNAENTINITSPSHLESNSDSNEAEYDLESFGIKESISSHPPTPKTKTKPKRITDSSNPNITDNEQQNISLHASLPSTSSFENHQNNNNNKPNIVSNVSSISSTPHSKKSILSNENRADLTKLKQKMKSNKQNNTKLNNNNNNNNNNDIVNNTPITKKKKNTVIQTPRHSLKHSLKSSRNTSKSSSISSSPKRKQQIKDEISHKNEIIEELQNKISKYEMDIKRIECDAESKVKNAESKLFAIECKLKQIENNKINNKLNEDSSERILINREIEEMERIITGLNAENAKLSKQLKEQKIDLQQSQKLMYLENQKINNNLMETQHQLTEIQENKIEELQPAAYNEIQRLRKQLKEIENTSRWRERELGLEKTRLKEENRELQFKLNGIDKKTFENESDIIQQFKTEALKIQKKSQTEINELKRKLKWYIENQQLIENLNKQIMTKNEEIISLKSQTTSQSVSESTSPPLIHKNNNKRNKHKPTPNEHRQIVILKKKVNDLEKLLSSKHPDSIANLIAMMNNGANNNDNNNNNIIIKQLREQIVLLQDMLNNKEDETLARLRGLRQQNDKLQLQLNNKINNLKQQLIRSKREKGFIRPSTKIKELEKQIIDLKQIHNKKIKLLKDKNNYNNYNNNNNNNKQIIELQNDLKVKINDIDILNNKLNQKQSMIENLQTMIDTEKQSHNDLKTQISLLQIQLKNAIKKQEENNNININSNERDNDHIDNNNINNDCKVDEKKENEEKERMYIEKIKIMESEINEYKGQCQILTEKIELEKSKGEQSVKAIQNQLEWNKLEKEKIEQLINKLQFELNHAKNTPSYVEYKTLLLKLEKIEKRGSEREKELEGMYMKLLQTNDDIEEKLTKKYETIINNKNQQIKSLQNELSVLMTAFDKIQSN